MATEYDKADCKDLHQKIEAKLDKLETRMNWFYILAISTLVAFVLNLVKGL